MKRFELRLPDETYEGIWKIHAETKKSLNQIIVDILNEKIEEKS